MADSVGASGSGMRMAGDTGRQRPVYGVVFCEVPPAGQPGALRPGVAQRRVSGAEQAGGGGGVGSYVSAEPARRHLAALGRAGVGLKTVARLSGVSHGSLSKIVYGEPGRGRPPSRRIRVQTNERILAVTETQARGGQRVDAGPTWQLIEELVAAGYTRAHLARELGSQAASPTLQIGRRLVRASTARAVEELHRRLIGREGPGRGRPKR